jgi:hypothetical protein
MTRPYMVHKGTPILHLFIFYYLFFIFPFVVVLCGVHCDIDIGSYNVPDISYMNSLPPPFSFIPPPLIPGIVTTGIEMGL